MNNKIYLHYFKQFEGFAKSIFLNQKTAVWGLLILMKDLFHGRPDLVFGKGFFKGELARISFFPPLLRHGVSCHFFHVGIKV
jgi:hypothetical protein